MRQLLITELKHYIKVKKINDIDPSDLDSAPMKALENIHESLVSQYWEITEKEKLNLSFD